MQTQNRTRGQRQNQRRRRSQRGMGMAVTMLVLLGILTLTLVGTVGSNSSHGYNGILGMTNNALQASSARTQSTASFNMAESGIQYTLAWLGNVSKVRPPIGNAQAPTGWDFTTVGGRGVVTPDAGNPGSYFSVRIYPDAYNQDVNSPTSNQKKYLIESIGVSGGMVSIVQAYVEQSSLAQYLVLLNSWNNPNNYWVSGLTTFDGPVHDNNIGADGHGANGNTQTPDGTAENIVWKSAAGTAPMFTYTGNDAYSTSSPTGVNWVKDFSSVAAPQIIYNTDGTVKTNQWLNVAAGGAGTVHTGTPVVPFPTSNGLQKTAAVGSAAVTNPFGVTLCPNGGVYVEGNVSEMALSTTGTNNTTQVMTITQQSTLLGTTVQRVTIDPVAGTKLETQQSNGTWLQTGYQSGTTNGVVYVNGNIGTPSATDANGNPGDPKTNPLSDPTTAASGKQPVGLTGGLHGTIADNALDGSGNVTHNSALTIATPQADSTNLDGSLTYNTERQIAKNSSGQPEYIDVNGNPTTDPTKGTPVYVPESTDTNFTNRAGTLGLITNNAMVTQKDSTGAALTKFEMDGTVLASGNYDADNYTGRPVGLWENMGGYLSQTVGTFGVFNNSLQLTNGFNTQFNYDARMRNNPPPFFPTTGYAYTVISWHQVAQPIEP